MVVSNFHMAVAGCRWPGNTGMADIERERAVADAIVLERAAGVLKRRSPDGLRYDVAWLEHYAGVLRKEAERDD
jgi:hypothetical protein